MYWLLIADDYFFLYAGSTSLLYCIVIVGKLDQRHHEGPMGGVPGAAGGLHRALLLRGA